MLYHLAEINRLYKCDFLNGQTNQLQSFLSDANGRTTVADLYYGHLLTTDAKNYGLSTTNDVFSKKLSQ